MAEFEVERAEQSYIQIRHASEGHRYMLHIAETEDGERIIDGGMWLCARTIWRSAEARIMQKKRARGESSGAGLDRAIASG